MAFFQDIRVTTRTLAKSPVLAASAIATVALTLGPTITLFGIVNEVMLRPLPYEEPRQLVTIWGTSNVASSSLFQPSVADLVSSGSPVPSSFPGRWAKMSKSFSCMASYKAGEVSIGDGANIPARVKAGFVSQSFLPCLGIQPAIGRNFVEPEMIPGRDNVVILKGRARQRLLQADAQLIGSTIRLEGKPYTVIGVMPGAFEAILPDIASDVTIWMPMSHAYARGRTWAISNVVARLKPPTSLEAAQAEMNSVAANLAREGRPFQGHGIRLVRLHDQIVKEIRPVLLTAFGSAFCVVLMACANLAGLMLASASRRQRELSTRSALGASPVMIVKCLLTECFVIALSGGFVALLLGLWISKAVVLLNPWKVPRLGEVRPDIALVFFTVALSLVIGVFIGLPAILQFFRTSVIESLKASASLVTPNRSVGLRKSIVVGQIALAVILVTGAGLLLRSFVLLKAVQPGFDPQNLLTMTIPLPESLYRSPEQVTSFVEMLLARVRTTPGVRYAAVSNSLPMVTKFLVSTDVRIEGRVLPEGDSGVFMRAVSEDYLSTMGIRLIEGRFFVKTDGGKSDVVVLNAMAAQKYWLNENPLGRSIVVGDGQPRTVIGVVEDVKPSSLDLESVREVYLPFSDAPAAIVGLALRTYGEPSGTIVSNVRAALRAIDRTQAVEGISTMTQAIDRSVARPRFNLTVIAAFAFLAVLLAVIGVYGFTSYSILQRTREVGIRIALGANERRMFWTLICESALLGGIGVALGYAGILAISKAWQHYLFGVTPRDGLTIGATSMFLFCVCLVAAWVPAWRAAHTYPMAALREL
jgi:putative ABC transport system permease protein